MQSLVFDSSDSMTVAMRIRRPADPVEPLDQTPEVTLVAAMQPDAQSASLVVAFRVQQSAVR